MPAVTPSGVRRLTPALPEEAGAARTAVGHHQRGAIALDRPRSVDAAPDGPVWSVEMLAGATPRVCAVAVTARQHRLEVEAVRFLTPDPSGVADSEPRGSQPGPKRPAGGFTSMPPDIPKHSMPVVLNTQ